MINKFKIDSLLFLEPAYQIISISNGIIITIILITLQANSWLGEYYTISFFINSYILFGLGLSNSYINWHHRSLAKNPSREKSSLQYVYIFIRHHTRLFSFIYFLILITVLIFIKNDSNIIYISIAFLSAFLCLFLYPSYTYSLLNDRKRTIKLSILARVFITIISIIILIKYKDIRFIIVYPFFTAALYLYLDVNIVIDKKLKFNKILMPYFYKQNLYEFYITILSIYFIILPAPIIYLMGYPILSGKIGITMAIFNSIIIVFGALITSQINKLYNYKNIKFIDFFRTGIIIHTFIVYVSFILLLNLILLIINNKIINELIEYNDFMLISVFSILYFFIFNIFFNKIKIDQILSKIRFDILSIFILIPIIAIYFFINKIILILLIQLFLLLIILIHSHARK